MKGFDVLKVKSAVKSHNKFDLSRTHLTTMNFGEIVPLLAEETIPGDKFSIDAEYFSRLAPLVKPTYGKFQFKTCSAFVPYHQIAYDIDAWMAGKTTWEGQIPKSRYIPVGNLAAFIYQFCATTSGATATNCDFTYVDASGTQIYMLYHKKGKYMMKIMNALGYTAPQGVDLQTSSVWYNSIRNQNLSALPLIAFFKLYNDYMSQSQRFNSSILSSVLNSIKYGKNYSGVYDASAAILYPNGIDTLFTSLFLNYENDYFTSAWQQPNSAINSIENITSAATPSSTGTVTDDIFDTKLSTSVQTGTPNYVQIGQRALDFLKSFDDWVRRNNYSGSRAVQQLYSRFGIKTDDYRSHYANVLSTDSLPIQIGDVTATSQQYINGDAKHTLDLGDYSGKGIMSGSKGISCQISDYGIILILGYFTVTPMNAYGYDRKVLRKEPLDFYNPEFDGLGAEAISFGELYANPTADASDTTRDDAVFGYTERYNSYRYGRDQITGEFRNYHADGDMNVWHTGRNLNAIRRAGNMVAQSTAMNTLPQTDSEYNRIFSVTSGDVDHFYLTARFNVSAIRPMLNLNQVPRLGEGDTAVPRNGNVIS